MDVVVHPASNTVGTISERAYESDRLCEIFPWEDGALERGHDLNVKFDLIEVAIFRRQTVRPIVCGDESKVYHKRYIDPRLDST